MPAKAGIQYAAPLRINYNAAEYWIIRRSLSSGAHSRDPFADDDSGERGRRPSPSLLQILLHLRAQAVAQIGARHAVGDVGAQEAGF